MFLNFNMGDPCRLFPAFPSKIILFYTCLYQAHGFLRLYEEDAGDSTPYLRPLKPTSVPPNKSYDELLDELIVVETSRKAALKKAVGEATRYKNNATLKFLEATKQGDEELVKIRQFFDAGRIYFDFGKGKYKFEHEQIDAYKKTALLREKDYFSNQVDKVTATHATIESEKGDLPKEELGKLQPLFDSFDRSYEALNPLVTQFLINMKEDIKLRPG